MEQSKKQMIANAIAKIENLNIREIKVSSSFFGDISVNKAKDKTIVDVILNFLNVTIIVTLIRDDNDGIVLGVKEIISASTGHGNLFCETDGYLNDQTIDIGLNGNIYLVVSLICKYIENMEDVPMPSEPKDLNDENSPEGENKEKGERK